MIRKTRVDLLTRKQFLALSTSGCLYLVGLSTGAAMAFPHSQKSLGKPSQALGTTFSPLQCRYMGLDYRDAFRQVCALGFDRLRLCSYWNEIEATENKFDFSTIDWLLEESHRCGIDVALTVGMKAPRWPEFHFPDWLQERYDTTASLKPIDRNPAIADHTLKFIDAVVNHTRNAPHLKYWQVENEPFTHLEITGGRFLSYEFVRREVELVRSRALPGQKILLTNAIALPFANDKEDDRAFQESLALADAVGINVYTKVPAGNSSVYLQPFYPFWRKLRVWQRELVEHQKEDWIAEAQAEPWEPNQLVAMGQADYPSSSPQQITNLVRSLRNIGYGTVMLWGCEYWHWHRQNGRELWWQAVQQLQNA